MYILQYLFLNHRT